MLDAAPAFTVEEGQRTYIKADEDFGTVVRPSFLGLEYAPVVLLDDGTMAGYAGQRALEEIVLTSTGKNSLDEDIAVPLDVRIVGTEVMNAMNVPAPVQASMYQNFRALSKADRTTLTDKWAAANAGSDSDRETFVEEMMAQLGSAAP